MMNLSKIESRKQKIEMLTALESGRLTLAYLKKRPKLAINDRDERFTIDGQPVNREQWYKSHAENSAHADSLFLFILIPEENTLSA